MNKGLLGKATISVAVLSIALITIFVMTFVLPSFADSGSAICTSTGTYNVCTDKADYSPEQTVMITGSGFNDYTLQIKVIRPDGSIVDGDGLFNNWTTEKNTVDVVDGNFVYNYTLDGVQGTYVVYVSDGINDIATHVFTDSVNVRSVASSNSSGTTKTSFLTTDDVYAHINTTGGGGSTTARLYVVTSAPVDKQNLTDVSGGYETIAVSGDSTTMVWINPTTPGTYYIVSDDNADGIYKNNEHVSSAFTITGKSDQTITFGSLSDKTYGDADFSVSATASSGLTVSFTASGNCSMADASTVHITGAGSCTITASQLGNGTYNPAPNVNQSFTISKANPTIVVTPYDVTYNAVAHTATGTAKGVLDEDLTVLDLTSTSHTNAGNYTNDSWTFTDTSGNYNNVNGTVNDTISKADANVTVTGYNETYDALAHGATGTAIGVNDVDLNAGLNLGATFIDYPGGTAFWTFDGGTNYLNESGSVSIIINKVDATIIVTPYSVTYDALVHTATGSAKGVLNEDLSGLDLNGTNHTNAGNYTDSWTFADVTGNYNNAAGTVHDFIGKKALTITANNYSKTFGNTYTFAGTEFTTLGLINPPDTVTSVTLTSDGAINTAYVGSYDIVASNAVGTGLANYNITYINGTLTVNQLKTTTAITPASAQYSDPITLTATISPATAGGQTLTGSVEFFISGISVGSNTTNSSGVATLSGISNSRASGSYNVKAVFTSANSNFTDSENTTGTLGVIRENTAIAYNGDSFVTTAGPSITTAPVQLSANLTQENDSYPGDITKAKVTFMLIGASAGSSIIVKDIPVSLAGDALTTVNVPVGTYRVFVRISDGNIYWIQSPAGTGSLTVDLGDNEQRVTGGGWIPDPLSANSKDNFGFTVYYNKNGAPKGNFLFIFRNATDGYDYQLKSNSWAKGGLSFTSANTSFFTAKATLSKIDRVTGEVVDSDGSYTFLVNIKDGDLTTPKSADTFAITIFDSSNNVWKQIGTSTAQINLSGGNIVIHSK